MSRFGQPPFIAVPFDETVLSVGVNVALADKLVFAGELSVGAGAKLASMAYADYLSHLGRQGYSMIDPEVDLEAELRVFSQG